MKSDFTILALFSVLELFIALIWHVKTAVYAGKAYLVQKTENSPKVEPCNGTLYRVLYVNLSML